MHSEKLTEIKKELRSIPAEDLINICLRLAKYKKENKELLSYLIFESHDLMGYVEQVKASLGEEFNHLPSRSFQAIKVLRKILRGVNKYSKYTGSKEAEIELLLWYCSNYTDSVNLNSSYKPLQLLLFRQIIKIQKLLLKLNEDLQFDYQQQLEILLAELARKVKGFDKNGILV